MEKGILAHLPIALENQQFDASNVILFQIKVFSKNIKETTLVSYFTKVTARSSFTRLRVIKRINRVH